MKRISYLHLAIIMLIGILTGCTSIIYDGDFAIEPYDAPTIVVNTAEKLEEEQYDKYNIGGTNAFYILPDHVNDPSSMIDFLVLDYNSKEEYVYAYTTYFCGNGSPENGLTVSEEGTAPVIETVDEDTLIKNTDQDNKTMVSVLMSYDPKTRAYHVLFSQLWESETGSGLDVPLFGHKLQEQEEYFFFFGTTAYVFHLDGSLLFEQNVELFLQDEFSNDEYSAYKDYTIDIADIVMDNYYYYYISIILIPPDSTGEEEELVSILMNCYYLDIETPQEITDSSIVFTSRNVNYEKQIELYESLDGTVYTGDNAYQIASGKNLAEIESMYYYTPFSYSGIQLMSQVVDEMFTEVDIAYNYKINEAIEDYNVFAKGQYYYNIFTMMYLQMSDEVMEYNKYAYIKNHFKYLVPYAQGIEEQSPFACRAAWAAGLLTESDGTQQYIEFQDPNSEYFYQYSDMKILETAPTLTRTMYIEEEVNTLGSGGSIETETVRWEKQESWTPNPIEYYVEIASKNKNITMSWSDSFQSTEMVDPSNDLGAIYYDSYTTTGDQIYSYIRYNNGDMDVLNDSNVLGNALGATTYYADDKEILAFLTDQGVKFYQRSNNNQVFSSIGFVSLADFVLEGADIFRVIGQDSDTGYVDTIYRLNQFTFMNENKMIVSTLNSGLFLYFLDKGMSLPMRDGAYYTVHTTTGGSNVILGFDTEEYYYNYLDIVWAKCYEIEAFKSNTDLQEDVINNYLTLLSNIYLQLTHRVTTDESGNTIVSTYTDQELAFIERGENLFYSTEANSLAELVEIVTDVEFSTVTANMQLHLKELREQAATQLEGLEEFYELAEVLYDPGSKSNLTMLQIEGALVYANYTTTLEDILVAMQTLDLESSLTISNTTDSAEDLVDELVTSSGAQYVTQLNALKAEYEAKGYDVSWDDKMQALLSKVSPYNAVDRAYDGYLYFCEIANINRELVDEEALQSQYASVIKVTELEALIVSYKVGEVTYQNKGYESEYYGFINTRFLSDAEKQSTFESAGFYGIIEDLKLANAALLEEEDSTWTQLLEDVIASKGTGAVIFE